MHIRSLCSSIPGELEGTLRGAALSGRTWAGALLVAWSAMAGSVWISSDMRAAPAPAPKSVGAISGIVTFRGAIPQTSISDDAGRRRDLIAVDAQNGGLKGVVVHLEAVEGARPSAPVRRGGDVTVDQQDYMFEPGVVAIQNGQTIAFTNSDPANHNVRTSAAGSTNEFNVIVPNGAQHRHRFTGGNGSPVRLSCDIHPWMRGWVYVFDHSLFAVTDEHGAFQIVDVPPGKYRVIVRHPELRARREQRVSIGPGAVLALDFQLNADGVSSSAP